MNCPKCKTTHMSHMNYCPLCGSNLVSETARPSVEALTSSEWVAADELEKAWREGYDSGYNNGSNDAHAYEWGSGSNKRTARDKDDEWNGSETKAATQ